MNGIMMGTSDACLKSASSCGYCKQRESGPAPVTSNPHANDLGSEPPRVFNVCRNVCENNRLRLVGFNKDVTCFLASIHLGLVVITCSMPAGVTSGSQYLVFHAESSKGSSIGKDTETATAELAAAAAMAAVAVMVVVVVEEEAVVLATAAATVALVSVVVVSDTAAVDATGMIPDVPAVDVVDVNVLGTVSVAPVGIRRFMGVINVSSTRTTAAVAIAVAAAGAVTVVAAAAAMVTTDGTITADVVSIIGATAETGPADPPTGTASTVTRDCAVDKNDTHSFLSLSSAMIKK